jgi:DNA-binding MarR family transcriptional regulator
VRRVVIELTEQQAALLEWVTERRGRTLPELLQEWLEREAEELKRRLGLR